MKAIETFVAKNSTHLIKMTERTIKNVDWSKVGTAVTGGVVVYGAPLLAVAAIGVAGYCVLKVVSDLIEE